MTRKTNAKQTNARFHAWQPNKQMVESEGRRSLPKWQKQLSMRSKGNNAKGDID